MSNAMCEWGGAAPGCPRQTRGRPTSPILPGRDVRDVPDHRGYGCVGGELPTQQVRDRCRVGVGLGQVAPSGLDLAGDQFQLTDQVADEFDPDEDPA